MKCCFKQKNTTKLMNIGKHQYLKYYRTLFIIKNTKIREVSKSATTFQAYAIHVNAFFHTTRGRQ